MLRNASFTQSSRAAEYAINLSTRKQEEYTNKRKHNDYEQHSDKRENTLRFCGFRAACTATLPGTACDDTDTIWVALSIKTSDNQNVEQTHANALGRGIGSKGRMNCPCRLDTLSDHKGRPTLSFHFIA